MVMEWAWQAEAAMVAALGESDEGAELTPERVRTA
jgi:hypothetical protein